MRYSPKELAEYPAPAMSMILSRNPLAWNLAWLSWDWEARPTHPDPNFTSRVHRTLQVVLADGSLDVAGLYPDSAKVSGLMLLPAPAAAFRILSYRKRERLPLFFSYGPGWLEVVMARSHLFREPHHPVLDAPVENTASAMTYLSRL